MSNKNTVRIVSIVLLGFSLILWGSIIIPSFIKDRKEAVKPMAETAWQEQPQRLSETEAATMSANFSDDFEKNLRTINASPTPTPFFAADIPASMAGDLTPPTATIQGSAAEGAVIAGNDLCFPLWVSDNLTPWQRLQTRGKMDSNQWSIWMETFSYCFQNLGIGRHTFSTQIRDLAGNVSPEITRTFIVRQ